MSGDLTLMGDSPFDAIRRTREDGSEYWSARDLQPLMGYTRWESFLVPVERAMRTAENTNLDVASNFRGSPKISATRPGQDYELTRFAAYLIAMNGDPNKPEVAEAQLYFATKTREAEVAAEAVPVPEQRPMTELEMARNYVAALERLAIAEPAANSWNQLAEAGGDYAVADAAKILSRDQSISIGRDRLFAWLKDQGWVYRGESGRFRPYQRAVDAGRLAERLQSSEDSDGVRVPRAPQVRVTTKGLHDLHRMLGGSGPLLVEVAS